MTTNNIKRCASCIIPANAEGILLDENNVCQLCKGFVSVKLKGRDDLLREIDSFRNNSSSRYNCIVPVSGGRDSAYALYYAKNELDLNPIAFHNDNDFETKIATENLNNITKRLSVPLIKLKSSNNRTKKIVSHKFKINIPYGPGIVVDQTCEACKYGFEAGAYKIAKENDIKIVIWGDSIAESTSSYHDIVKHIKPTKFQRLLSPTIFNLFKYKLHFNRMKKEYGPDSPNGIKEIHLYDYIQWDRVLIVETIKDKMNWQSPEDSATSWRIDCSLVPIINYLTKKAYGVSKIELGFSQMIRSGKMDRNEALKEIEQIDSHIDVDNIATFLKNQIDLSDQEINQLLL